MASVSSSYQSTSTSLLVLSDSGNMSIVTVVNELTAFVLDMFLLSLLCESVELNVIDVVIVDVVVVPW